MRLAQLGFPHVVVDSRATPTLTSNAALVHASSLELLGELGVGNDLVAAGRVIRRIVMVDRGRPLVRVELTDLRAGTRSLSASRRAPRRSCCCGGWASWVGRCGACIECRRSRPRSAIRSWQVSTSRPAYPVPFEIRARYVVGADGSHSMVRSAIGLAFPGETYDSQFVLADVELEYPGSVDDEATISMSSHGVTVIARLPSGNHRMIATVDAGAKVPDAPDRAFVDALLHDRGVGAQSASEPVWASRFRVHHRVADRFRVEGVFLAGDAAHVHSPAAGQGMNTGIADAYDVSTRLAAVLNGEAGEPTLDRYEQARRAAALEVLRFTDRMTRVAMLDKPVPVRPTPDGGLRGPAPPGPPTAGHVGHRPRTQPVAWRPPPRDSPRLRRGDPVTSRPRALSNRDGRHPGCRPSPAVGSGGSPGRQPTQTRSGGACGRTR